MPALSKSASEEATTEHALTHQLMPSDRSPASKKPASLRPPEQFCLPPGYKQQDTARTREELRDDAPDGEYWAKWRLEMSAVYQKHVYEWAARLVRERKVTRLLDVGCGPATKLAQHIAPLGCKITGIDQPKAIEIAQRQCPSAEFLTDDLEHPEFAPASPSNTLQEPPYHLVICADVIEHLLDPDPMLAMLGRAVTPNRAASESHRKGLVLLSTPDRDRVRGRDCREAKKPEHVREWSAPEFLAYLRSRDWEIISSRLMPGDDRPVRSVIPEERRFRAGMAQTSPMKCHAVLCRPL